MKKLTPSFLLAVLLIGTGMPAWAAEQKIAMFNMRKAFESYYKTIQSNVALKQEKAEVDKEEAQMIDTAKMHVNDRRKLIERANDQALSAEEREKSKRAIPEKEAELETDKESINQFEQTAAARFREKMRLRTDDILKEITGVVEAHAKTGGYAMVLDSSGIAATGVPVVLYTNGQDDLTEVIIKELNAAAPPGSLDTNAVPILSTTNMLPGLGKQK